MSEDDTTFDDNLSDLSFVSGGSSILSPTKNVDDLELSKRDSKEEFVKGHKKKSKYN